MPDRNSKSLSDVYVKASTLDTRPRTYFIGPYGRRVSFLSQQTRTLLTIWALSEKGMLTEGKEVAVIGGGVAGMMAAAALLSRKCLVWLYETRPKVLDVQSLAVHRYVHPSVNFWPEKPLNPTTELPFYDWYAVDCARAIQVMKKEWETHFRDKVTQTYRSTVSDVQFDSSKKKVVVIGDGEAPPTAEYDLAIATTGFGDEESVAGTNGGSYWIKDDFHELAETAESITISGTGDGGLIEVLRMIHRHFDDGEIAVKLAAALSTTGITASVARLESEVPEESKGDERAASTLYATRYRSVVDATPQFCTKVLTDSYREKCVDLLGYLPQPFSLYSAPIHKFMVAHALKERKINYIEGELKDGPVFVPRAGAERAVVADICIARHGLKKVPPSVLTQDEATLLKEKQRWLADFIEDIPYTSGFWHLSGYPVRDVRSKNYALFRHPLASTYVNLSFNHTLGLAMVDGLPTYMMEIEPGRQSPSNLPITLFGIPLDKREKEIANDLIG